MYRSSITVFTVAATVGLYTLNDRPKGQPVDPANSPDTTVRVLRNSGQTIEDKLAEISNPDETDLSPTTQALEDIDRTLCEDDSVKHPCLPELAGDGLKDARERLRLDTKNIVANSSQDEGGVILTARSHALATVITRLDSMIGQKPVQIAGYQAGH